METQHVGVFFSQALPEPAGRVRPQGPQHGLGWGAMITEAGPLDSQPVLPQILIVLQFFSL